MMKMVPNKKIIAGVVVAIIVIASVGWYAYTLWSTPPSEEKLLIGVSMYVVVGEKCIAMIKTLEEKAEELNVEIVILDARLDVVTQVSQIHTLLALNPDGLIVYSGFREAVNPLVQEAIDMGIPVTAWDHDLPNTLCHTTDQVEVGRLAGQEAVKLLTEKYGEPKGTVLELWGLTSAPLCQDRHEGFYEEISQYPEINLIEQETEWRTENAYDIVLTTAATVELDVIFPQSDLMLPGVLSALDVLGLKKPVGDSEHIFITSIDGSWTAFGYIGDNWVDSTVYDPVEVTPLSLENVVKLINGEEIADIGDEISIPDCVYSPIKVVENRYGGKSFVLGLSLVTAENVDDSRFWPNYITP